MRLGSFAHRPCSRAEPYFSIGLLGPIFLAICRASIPTSNRHFQAAMSAIFPIFSRRFIPVSQPFFLSV